GRSRHEDRLARPASQRTPAARGRHRGGTGWPSGTRLPGSSPGSDGQNEGVARAEPRPEPRHAQYPPVPRGPPAAVGPPPPAGGPPGPPPCPHPTALGGRTPVGDGQRRPVLLVRHRLPVEAAVRRGGGGRCPRPAARSPPPHFGLLGGGGGAVGAVPAPAP